MTSPDHPFSFAFEADPWDLEHSWRETMAPHYDVVASACKRYGIVLDHSCLTVVPQELRGHYRLEYEPR